MAAKVTSVSKIGPRAWVYAWSGTSPFKLYSPDLDIGRVQTTVATFTAEWNDIEHTPDSQEPPILEVIDATQTTADVQSLTYPNKMRMQWRAADTFSNYFVVENKAGTAWVKKQIVSDVVDPGYYSFTSTSLADGSTHQWRVTPEDSGGTTGNPLAYDMFAVNNGGAPSISDAFSSGTGNITISAR